MAKLKPNPYVSEEQIVGPFAATYLELHLMKEEIKSMAKTANYLLSAIERMELQMQNYTREMAQGGRYLDNLPV